MGAVFLDAEPDCNADANLVIKNVATLLPSPLAAGPRIALEIHNPNLIELPRDHLAEPVKRTCI